MIDEGVIVVNQNDEKVKLKQYEKILQNYHIKGLLTQAMIMNINRIQDPCL